MLVFIEKSVDLGLEMKIFQYIIATVFFSVGILITLTYWWAIIGIPLALIGYFLLKSSKMTSNYLIFSFCFPFLLLLGYCFSQPPEYRKIFVTNKNRGVFYVIYEVKNGNGEEHKDTRNYHFNNSYVVLSKYKQPKIMSISNDKAFWKNQNNLTLIPSSITMDSIQRKNRNNIFFYEGIWNTVNLEGKKFNIEIIFIGNHIEYDSLFESNGLKYGIDTLRIIKNLHL